MDDSTKETNETREPATGRPADTPPANTQPGTMKQDPVMIFLAYFGIFALIPYLTVKDNDFVRWHAKQGLTYLVASVALFIALIIVSVVLAFIPYLGALLSTLIWLIVPLGLMALWVIALVKAFGGERWKIPLVGDLAEKW